MEPGLVALEQLAATLARTFHTPCRIRPETFDVSFALDEGRHQYYSTSILQRLERDLRPGCPDAGRDGVRPLRSGVSHLYSGRRSWMGTAR